MSELGVDLSLPEDLLEDVEQEILRRVQRAVEDAQGRDSILSNWADAMDGISAAATSSSPRWANSCDLDDPMTLNGCVTIDAQANQLVSRQLGTVEASEPEDEEAAEAQETFIESKVKEHNIRQALRGVFFNTTRYPVAILSLKWEQKIRYIRKMVWMQDGVEVDGPDEEGKAEEVPARVPEVEYEGVRGQCVETTDFYMYPWNSKSIEVAWGVGERLLLSADDLLRGIQDFGYDREKVMNLLAKGPTIGTANIARQRRNRFYGNGADDSPGAQSDDGFYECFVWFSKLPLLMDEEGEIRIPEDYIHDDVMTVCCPEHKIVLKMNFSPYREQRPYIPFYMFRDENSFYGYCIPQILDALQSEANATTRFRIDTMNLRANPVLLTTSQAYNDLNEQGFQFYPGAMMKLKNIGDVQMLEMPPPDPDMIPLHMWMDSKAVELYSSGGFGAMPTKSRKAAEIQQVQVQAASKFDLFASYMKTGVEELMARIVSLYAEHMPDEGDMFADENGQWHKISPQQLKGRFQYHAIGTSANTNPEIRAQTAEKVLGIVTGYITASVQMAQVAPDKLKMLWGATRQLLFDLGCHKPENYIGKEPSAQPQPMMGIPGMQQGAGSAMPAGGAPGGQPGQQQSFGNMGAGGGQSPMG